MQIEIVEFYVEERKKNYMRGTMHIYIVDDNIDLRGWMFIKNKDKWSVQFPAKFGTDPETGVKIKYPVFNYTNPQKNKELFNVVREEGIKYITNKEKADGQAN